MIRSLPAVALVAAWSGMAAPVAQARIPGTLNFQNVTTTRITALSENPGNEKEVEFGDFDNDGDLDVVVGNGYSDFGQRFNKLFRNDSGSFLEVSGNPVIPGFATPDVTRNAFFRDYDGDGWLDIIVVNDNNTAGDAGRTKVFINNHPGGVFSHFTEEGVVRLGAGTGGAACGAVSVDLDGLSGADLFVGNYPGPSQDTMYRNNGNAFFDDVTAADVPVDSDYTVDVAAADLNGDGRLDLLISNWGNNYIYYNHNQELGAGPGDFSYLNSTTSLGSTGGNENAMEPGDFDNDGDMDVYWSNGLGQPDLVLVNLGNDPSGKAAWENGPALPGSTQVTSRKATVADLNADGRVDVVVMKEAGVDSRPTILRNVTVPTGAIRFVDWSPSPAFPNGSSHMGWHAAAFDIEAEPDGYPDLFVGGNLREHLFLNVAGQEETAGDLGGVLPDAVYNGAPLAVVGSDGYVLEVLARGSAAPDPIGSPCPEVPEAESFTLRRVPSGAQVAVILNGCGDYHLEARAVDGGLLAESDRGADGIEEVLDFNAAGGAICLNVLLTTPCAVTCTSPAACCDANSDGVRDDACAWCDCADGDCAVTTLDRFADVGGPFGQCVPDGHANVHDRTHILRCFEDTSTCAAINADAGGPLTDCTPDGVCDVHDINHAMAVFQDESPCACGSPMPAQPPVVWPAAELILKAPRQVQAGGTVVVHAVVRGVTDLQSYQLQTAVSGGRSGRLTLERIELESRPDGVFGTAGAAYSARNVSRGRMLAGVDEPVAPQRREAYLASFTFRASSDATGSFVIDLDTGAGRTALVGPALSDIPIRRTHPATLGVAARVARPRNN